MPQMDGIEFELNAPEITKRTFENAPKLAEFFRLVNYAALEFEAVIVPVHERPKPPTHLVVAPLQTPNGIRYLLYSYSRDMSGPRIHEQFCEVELQKQAQQDGNPSYSVINAVTQELVLPDTYMSRYGYMLQALEMTYEADVRELSVKAPVEPEVPTDWSK